MLLAEGFSSLSAPSIAAWSIYENVTTLFYNVSLFFDTVPDGSLQYDQFSTSLIGVFAHQQEFLSNPQNRRALQFARKHIYTNWGSAYAHTFRLVVRHWQEILNTCCVHRYITYKNVMYSSKVRHEAGIEDFVLVSDLQNGSSGIQFLTNQKAWQSSLGTWKANYTVPSIFVQ